MERNLYAPPAAKVSDVAEPTTGELALASKGQRFLNVFIDSLVVDALMIAVGFVAGFAGGNIAESMANPWVTIGLSLGSTLTYYLLLEATGGRTLGKLVTGTQTVTADGGKPSVLQIVGRTFARMIPFEPFSFFNKNATGWHDKLSNTRVVRVRGK